MSQNVEITGYQLLRQLGEGGMATVYLAVQKSLERKVAIKILRTTNDDDPERTERRFLREGRTLAKITHRNVCGIYDIAKVGDVAYIAMEYLDGGTLVDRLREGLSVGESIAIVVQVASALQEAHNQGIVHRDLKPANVMMRGGKVPVLTDFGIARELSSHHTRITSENMIVGTPVYMSPEQVTGTEVDGRSDIYSLGIMFYELLTGSAPYKGDNPIQVCMQHLTSPVPTLGEELDELNPVLYRMLAKKADDRFATMTEFTHALRSVFVESPTLRTKAALQSDQAWTEQLRQMGFSFDTLRDGDFNAKLRAQQEAQKALERDAPLVQERIVERVVERGVSMKWVAAGLAGLVLLAGGGYWMFGRDNAKTQSLQLRGLATVLDGQIESKHLFDPADDNAAVTLKEMRAIDDDSEFTVQATKKFQTKLNEQFAELLKQQKIAAAQSLFDDATEADIFDSPAITDWQSRLSNARTAIANAKEIGVSVAALEALLKKAAPSSELAEAFVRLKQLSADDARAIALGEQVTTTIAARVTNAIINENVEAAQIEYSELKRVGANTAVIARFDADLQRLNAKRGVSDLLASARKLLAAPELDYSAITQIERNLESVRNADASNQDLPALRQQLIQGVARSADALIARKDPNKARELITALSEPLRKDPQLQPLVPKISAALEQLRLAEVSGVLVIDTVPYSTIEQISFGGKPLPLPAARTTPMKFLGEEGAYTITVRDQQNRRQTLNAVIERKTQKTVFKPMATGLDDVYLREAGF
jgi:serine/threonine-protein kinase PpkA